MLQSTTRRHLASRSILSSRQLRQFQTSTRAYADGSAFDPKTTKPEEQKGGEEEAESGAATGTNPVDSSANKSRDPQEGGSQGSEAENGKGRVERSGQSAGGSPPKAGGMKSGGGGGT